MRIIRTDRSRYEQGGRCLRARYWGYHFNNRGISPAKTPLPLAVGASVHEGLAVLLRQAQNDVLAHGLELNAERLRIVEGNAVETALMDFAQYRDAIDVEGERGGAVVEVNEPATAGSFGDVVYDDPSVRIPGTRGNPANSAMEYLFREQSALVEALVRAWARRKLRPLLEEFEVLEVEREGEWTLAMQPHKWVQAVHQDVEDVCEVCGSQTYGPEVGSTCSEIRFMSRPDALLRSRVDGSLTILSFKTAAQVDRRRLADTQRDMQGLTEGVEVERRLGEWWAAIRDMPDPWVINSGAQIGDETVSAATADYLRHLPAPPRILAIRYEFLVKGERWKDADLAAKLGDQWARRQKSHLVYGYANPGMAAGDEQWNWSYSHLKADGSGETSKLYYKNWRPRAVWEGEMTVARWIDMLDESVLTTSGETGAELGYSGPAQATGYTAAHPLDEVLPAAVTVYRNEDDLRDCIEQLEAGERRIAEVDAAVKAAADDGERRSLLNVHFPQSRRQCSYPTDCAYIPVCYGGEDIRRDPLASKLYVIRTANHPQEGSDAK